MPARTERDPYTPEELKRVTKNYLLGRKTRRHHVKGSAERNAAEAFVAEIAEIRDRPMARGEDRYTYYELSKDIMVPDEKHPVKVKPLPQRTLRAYLGRHGKEINPESQEEHKYQGYQPGYVPPRPSYRTEDHFTCKHWVDKDGNDVPEGTPGAALTYCEREGNTYEIRRGTQGGPRAGQIDLVCRRHRLAENYGQKAAAQ